NVVLELAFGWPFPSELGMLAQPSKSTRVAPRSKSDPVPPPTARAHVFCRSSARHIIIVVLIRVGGISSIGNGWKQEQRPRHWMAQLSGTCITKTRHS